MKVLTTHWYNADMRDQKATKRPFREDNLPPDFYAQRAAATEHEVTPEALRKTFFIDTEKRSKQGSWSVLISPAFHATKVSTTGARVDYALTIILYKLHETGMRLQGGVICLAKEKPIQKQTPQTGVDS